MLDFRWDLAGRERDWEAYDAGPGVRLCGSLTASGDLLFLPIRCRREHLSEHEVAPHEDR
jgi:hypothetical protein